jgi:hypothetical protein
MKQYINVNRNTIASNNKQGRDDPAISVRNYKEIKYGHKVRIKGEVEIVQAGPTTGEKPLDCGARVFVRIINPDTTIEVIK